MQNYPFLHLVVRFGTLGSILLAALVGLGTLWLTMDFIGLSAAVPSTILAIFVFIIAKTFVELVTLITELLLPQ